jgi:hypothetical protein
MSSKTPRIKLDLTRLLGFDQSAAQAAKVGRKTPSPPPPPP